MFDKLYIQLENDTIKYIVGSVSGNKAKIKGYGTKLMSRGSFANGKVLDADTFIYSLSELRKELGGYRGGVFLTVNDGSFITRPIELPILKEKDISRHLSLDAEQYLPIDKNNFLVDFRVLGRRNEADVTGSSIMVSAGPRSNIENMLNCFDKAKLDVRVIDVYPNNISRLLEGCAEADFAVIDMSMKNVNITIMENKKFYMHSFIAAHMDALPGAGNGWLKPGCTYDSYVNQWINQDDEDMPDDVRENLSGVLGQVTRYLDYFNSRHFGRTVECVYVIGELGMLKGLRGTMSAGFSTNVKIGLEAFDAAYNIGNKSFSNERMGYYSLLGMMLRGKKL